MICFNCKVEKACLSCLDLASQKKNFSTYNHMLKGEPPNNKHQILPSYVEEYEPKTSSNTFEAAKEVLITHGLPMVENRRFESTNIMIACKLYMKRENEPENKEVCVY